MSLHEALERLAGALDVAAMEKDELGEATRDMEFAHEDDVVAMAVADDRAAINHVLGAYAAAIEAARQNPKGLPPIGEESELPLEAHLRAERRFVARLDSKVLSRFAGGYRELADDARRYAQEGASSCS